MKREAAQRATQGWLSSYCVLDLTDQRGLLAGQMLAKLGADVIQVESPSGSPARAMAPFALGQNGGRHSLYWSAYAAGKRSVSCDLTTERGRNLLRQMLATADFVFESAEPGEWEQLGLSHAELRRANPGLIHVSITAFGSTGPKAHWSATDLTLWAAGGALLPTRNPGCTPLRITVPQSYLQASADAACGALIAHFARVQDGAGQHVDISAQQSVAQSTLASILSAAVGHENFSLRPEPKSQKVELDLSGSGARTRRSKWIVKDGMVELHLAIGPSSGRFTNNLFAWLHECGACDPAFASWDWAKLPARIESGEITHLALEAARECVRAFLSQRTKEELLREAIRRKVLLAPVATTEDLANSPHHAARGFFEEVSESDLQVKLPGPFAFAMTPVSVPPFVSLTAAPEIGQHNYEVYRELCGLSSTEVDELHEAGVI